jgi:type II secretory ATPase GspE/PulE/Tfp pilus assembly ATPase PilB-like protein
MTSEITDLCSERASASRIHEYAVENGMLSLTEHGWQKVRDGITTVEEIVRVAPTGDEVDVDLDSMDVDEELLQYL